MPLLAKQGWADAIECAQLLGQELNVPPESILLASTGVIGQRIKMEPLRAAIPQLVAKATRKMVPMRLLRLFVRLI